ncbi:DUF2989 domain-containing protein [Photobacterium leiognathi]|uniref:DUF2989 domain-containing protein n=1 Tax=Photobacterium leiognathi TaxID=553611 RepID=UPI00387F562F
MTNSLFNIKNRNRVMPIRLPLTCKILTGLSISLLLSGCFERHRTTDSLCEGYPALCKELNVNDGQCRIQRTTLIWQRYDVLKNPTDQEKFKELKDTQKYIYCLEYAARIEPTELKERKTIRMNALYDSYNNITRLNNELASSSDPEIIYYRWSQGDELAQNQFLELEGKPELETPDLQLALASYYISKDKDKTYQLLHHALSLYKKNEVVNQEIIKSLATLSQQQEKLKEAYIWVLIANDMNMPVTKSKKVANLFLLTEDEQSRLNKKATHILENLRNGSYKQNMVN